jgi:hypothetical protein
MISQAVDGQTAKRTRQSPTAFIVHSTQDIEIVQRLAAELRRLGIAVSADNSAILPGEPISARVAERIEAADGTIVVRARVRRPAKGMRPNGHRTGHPA